MQSSGGDVGGFGSSGLTTSLNRRGQMSVIVTPVLEDTFASVVAIVLGSGLILILLALIIVLLLAKRDERIRKWVTGVLYYKHGQELYSASTTDASWCIFFF